MDRQSLALLIPITAMLIPIAAIVMGGVLKLSRLRLEEAKLRAGALPDSGLAELDAGPWRDGPAAPRTDRGAGATRFRGAAAGPAPRPGTTCRPATDRALTPSHGGPPMPTLLPAPSPRARALFAAIAVAACSVGGSGSMRSVIESPAPVTAPPRFVPLDSAKRDRAGRHPDRRRLPESDGGPGHRDPDHPDPLRERTRGLPGAERFVRDQGRPAPPARLQHGKGARDRPAMNAQLQQVADELRDATARLHRLREAVPADRWPVRNDPARWSVSECVEHLNLTSAAFVPLLEAGLDAGARGTGHAAPVSPGLPGLGALEDDGPGRPRADADHPDFVPASAPPAAHGHRRLRAVAGETARLARRRRRPPDRHGC